MNSSNHATSEKLWPKQNGEYFTLIASLLLNKIQRLLSFLPFSKTEVIFGINHCEMAVLSDNISTISSQLKLFPQTEGVSVG